MNTDHYVGALRIAPLPIGHAMPASGVRAQDIIQLGFGHGAINFDFDNVVDVRVAIAITAS
jgi:hypothetical protein